MKDEINDHLLEEPPPIFKSWNHWYALVLITLATLILIFYLFTTKLH